MSPKIRKLLRLAGIVYLVFLAVILISWYRSPLPGVSLEKWILDQDDMSFKRRSDSYSPLRYFDDVTTMGMNFTSNTPALSLFKTMSFCERNFVGYSRLFAKLLNVVIDPSKGHGRRGGENISDVINQPEASEYYTLHKGYFNLQCGEGVSYGFSHKSHLSNWLASLNTEPKEHAFRKLMKEWTIAVQRYEYANLYHTMTDYYNAFLVAKVFNMSPGNITILWIDGHPSGALDETWRVLFGNVIRASDIRKPVMVRKMVWSIMGYESPLNHHQNQQVPFIEEFRTFFITRYGIQTTELNCDRLNITFLWRRDYVAHPRNPSGTVSRKIKNEDELITSSKNKFSKDNIQGVQIDLLPMKEQLNIISQTDILVGMHGAGLAHTLFLPNHAGLIELYPTYWPNANIHFQAMAKWRKLHYFSWVNTDLSRELSDHYTVVDTNVVVNYIGQMKQNICR